MQSAEKLPKLTIGMPVYNGERYIREAIESILAQSFTDFELIISDNASTDQTEVICKKYLRMDPRIKYIQQAETININLNFKFLLDVAESKYFMWMACDDCWETRDSLQKLMNKIEEGYSLCFPNIDLLTVGKNGNTKTKGVMKGFINCKSRFDFAIQTVHICSYQIYGLYNRQFLKEHFRYIEECQKFRCFSEGLFLHVSSSSANLAFVEDAVLTYRRHELNSSSIQKNVHLIIDFIKFTGKVMKFHILSRKHKLYETILIVKEIIKVHCRYFFVLVINQFK